MAERVAAAVVTYNRKELLAECLQALLGQSHPVEQVVLVDNASSDGTPELLRERGLLDDPRVRYERLESNWGSSGGFARAVELARAADVKLLTAAVGNRWRSDAIPARIAQLSLIDALCVAIRMHQGAAASAITEKIDRGLARKRR